MTNYEQMENTAIRQQHLHRKICIFAVIVLILVIINLGLSSAALHNSMSQQQQSPPSTKSYSLRLFPGDDLIGGIMKVVNEKQFKSAWIDSCVGSLTEYSIRFANMPYVNTSQRSSNETTYEIVSLVGTMTSNNKDSPGRGAWHLHIAVGNSSGVTVAGHLASPSIIYTTAEIVIGYDCETEYYRAVDGSTPWDELQIVRGVKWC